MVLKNPSAHLEDLDQALEDSELALLEYQRNLALSRLKQRPELEAEYDPVVFQWLYLEPVQMRVGDRSTAAKVYTMILERAAELRRQEARLQVIY